MKKEDALKLFLENEAAIASSKFVFESMSYLNRGQRKNTVRQFCSSIRQILREMPEVYFLQITLVRLKALAGQPFYRLEAYGADLYMTEPLMEIELELDWLYHAYSQFSQALEEESRKYIFQIGKAEIDRVKLAELYNCQKIIKYLFFETVGDLIETEEFMNLEVDKNVQFHLAEYRGAYEVLLTKNKDVELMGGWLSELLQAE